MALLTIAILIAGCGPRAGGIENKCEQIGSLCNCTHFPIAY